MSDERQGKISASYLERLKLCPPSWNLGLQAPKEETSALAAAGTNIHAAAAGHEVELKRKDRELADALIKRGDFIINGILKDPDAWEILEDQKDSDRLWAGHGVKMWSGLFDRYVIAENKDTEEVIAVVLDYKTGWKEQTNPAENMQLRAAAVLIKGRNPRIQKVYVALVERVGGSNEPICYLNEDIDLARIEISQVITTAIEGGGELNPSEKACEYCPAKTICSAAHREERALVETARTVTAEDLTNERLGQILTDSKVVEKFIAAAEAEAKRRLEEGQEIPTGDGKTWKLKPGTNVRKINDPQAAYERLSHLIPIERFTKCVTVKVGALEDAYAEATGEKGKTAADNFNAILSEVITESQNKPTLTQSKA